MIAKHHCFHHQWTCLQMEWDCTVGQREFHLQSQKGLKKRMTKTAWTQRPHHHFLQVKKRMTTVILLQGVFENMLPGLMPLPRRRWSPHATSLSIQLEIGRLRAEKRQVLFQMISIAPGPQHDNIENALSASKEIDKYSKQLSKVNTQTPQRSNRSPDF